jgi:hypothetical protein
VFPRRRPAPTGRRARPAVEALEDRCVPSVLTVTDAGDSGPNSLRGLLAAANPGDTINFASFNPTGPPLYSPGIQLTSGPLLIAKSVTISGPSGGPHVIVTRASSAPAFGVFVVNPGVTASISNLFVEAGRADFGGGINNAGTLDLTGVDVLNNAATGSGGAIYNTGVLSIHASAVASNTAADGGGGIENLGTLTLDRSELLGNTGGARGGGLGQDATGGVPGAATLLNSAIANNTAEVGGGIYQAAGDITIINSTVAENTSTQGGTPSSGGAGILVNSGPMTARLTIQDSTIARNAASGGAAGGGVLIVPPAPGSASAPVVALQNTIVAGNTAATGPDIGGTFTSRGNNLVSDSAGADGLAASDLRDIDPHLGALTYIGPTHGIPLLRGSPAINAGNAAGLPPGLTTDQALAS